MILLFAISSTLAVGSITIFGFANNLQSVPLSIVGVSYSLAAFPALAKLFSLGKKNEFLLEIATASKHIIFWSLPAIVLFIILRAQIVRTVLGSGQFSWSDTKLTAAALALFSISILAQSLILLLVRGYYAAGITIKPVIINVSASIFTIISSFVLIYWYKTEPTLKFFFDSILRVSNLNGTEILLLPLAFSIGMILNLIFLWISFEKDFGKLEIIIKKSFFESVFASFVIGYFAYISLDIFDNFLNINTTVGIFLQGFLSGLVGILFGLFVLIILGNQEIKEVAKTFNKKIFKVKPIVSGQEEL
jgi:putative peptidoglycan lipid II flippase